jgi:hypothetical protein
MPMPDRADVYDFRRDSDKKHTLNEGISGNSNLKTAIITWGTSDYPQHRLRRQFHGQGIFARQAQLPPTGVAVVEIDNGFRAWYLAALINQKG